MIVPVEKRRERFQGNFGGNRTAGFYRQEEGKLGIEMPNLRKYGAKPFPVAVVHGGPGAAGEMAPVARKLAYARGVLEPLQTAATLEGQVRELKTVLEAHGELPVTLIGFSWGAMLSYILAARYPALVRKLILISSGVYEEKYAAGIMETRLGRLGEGERKEVSSLMEVLSNPANEDRNSTMGRLGRLLAVADSYDPLPGDDEIPEYRYDIFQSVWGQAQDMRSSGRLLEMGRSIDCPVVAIHGDYDPHPGEGIKKSLASVIRDFRFIRLEKCGHYPWREREAIENFYKALENEVETRE